MSEKLKKVSLPLAATIAAGLLVGEAKAQPSDSPQKAKIEATSPAKQERLSIEEATAQTAARILQGKEVNYYDGWVNIEKAGTDTVKFEINDPILVYRGGATAEELDFAANHPRSKYWAIGHIQRHSGNLGQGNLILLPYNNNGYNVVFSRALSKAPKDTPAISSVKFPSDGQGSIDFAHPLDILGNPILDYEGHPADIASGFNK